MCVSVHNRLLRTLRSHSTSVWFTGAWERQRVHIMVSTKRSDHPGLGELDRYADLVFVLCESISKGNAGHLDKTE